MLKITNMKKEDFIHGQYYYMWFKDSRSWILKFDEFKGEQLKMIDGISPSDESTGFKGAWGDFDNIKQARPATPEEIYHLEECLKARKYVPIPTLPTINYQIY